MTDRELMQMALDVLEKIEMGGDPRWASDVTPALRARLAQPEREWKGLTKEEARELCVANVPYVVDMVAALEARLKEKNT